MLNRVILMGRLTADPELRKTASDLSVTSFTLAVNRNYGKGADTSDRLHQLCCMASDGGVHQQIFFQRQIDGCGRLDSGPQLYGQERQQASGCGSTGGSGILCRQQKFLQHLFCCGRFSGPRHLPARMGNPIPLLHLHSSSLHRLPVLDIPTVLPRNLRKSAMMKRIFPSKPLSGHLYLQL